MCWEFDKDSNNLGLGEQMTKQRGLDSTGIHNKQLFN